LYNLVTGRLPFEAENIYLLFQTIGKGIYKIPDDFDAPLTSLLIGLLHVNKHLRFTIKKIKQDDWFRRRLPRTYEYLPIPQVAIERFQTCTMRDYLTELHQSLTNDFDEQIMVLPDNHNRYHHCHPARLILNCSSKPMINDQCRQESKNQVRNQHRSCSLS
jgi:serine/threonine protein kinase